MGSKIKRNILFKFVGHCIKKDLITNSDFIKQTDCLYHYNNDFSLLLISAKEIVKYFANLPTYLKDLKHEHGMKCTTRTTITGDDMNQYLTVGMYDDVYGDHTYKVLPNIFVTVRKVKKERNEFYFLSFVDRNGNNHIEDSVEFFFETRLLMGHENYEIVDMWAILGDDIVIDTNSKKIKDVKSLGLKDSNPSPHHIFHVNA